MLSSIGALQNKMLQIALFSTLKRCSFIITLQQLPFLKSCFLQHPRTRKVLWISEGCQMIIRILLYSLVSISQLINQISSRIKKTKARNYTDLPIARTNPGTSEVPQTYTLSPNNPDGSCTQALLLWECQQPQSFSAFGFPSRVGCWDWIEAGLRISCSMAARGWVG